MSANKPDVVVTSHGTIFSVLLNTRRAKTWWAEHVNEGLVFGPAKIVEHRYIADIVNGMIADQLKVI